VLNPDIYTRMSPWEIKDRDGAPGNASHTPLRGKYFNQ